MTDREQVIAELQYMKRDVLEDSENDITLNKAIALLKEQEPALPTWSQGKAYCGNCGKRLPRKMADRETNYCSCCGRGVKWE